MIFDQILLYLCIWFTVLSINIVDTIKPRKIFTDGIKIVNVQKQIDMKSPVITITSKVTYENNGTKTKSNVYFIINKVDLQHIAIFSFKEGNNQKRNVKLSLFKDFIINSNKNVESKYKMYEVALNKPLSPNNQIEIIYVQEMTHKQKAFPSEILLNEIPSYKFKDTINFISPYIVENQKLVINTYDKKIININPKANIEKKSTYEYDINEEIDPFIERKFEIDYNSLDLYITSDIYRKVYISEYQEVEFIESHIITNKANKLTGTFSRVDFESNKNVLSYVLQNLKFKIPKDSYNYYYRDSVGNISTSTIADTRNSRFMIIQPRFPIMGGWNTEFTIKYKRPIQKIIKKNINKIDEDRHFKINLIGSCNDLVSIDNFVLEIILPEYAKFDIKKIPNDIDLNITQYKTFDYMDIKGRPTLRIEGKNILPSQDTILEFSYEYNSLYLMWKPYYASFLFMIIFLTISFINRSRIFLSKSSDALLKVDDLVQIFAKLDLECKKKFDLLESFLFTIDSYKNSNLNFEQFENSCTDILSLIKTQDEIIDNFSNYILDILPESKLDIEKKRTLLNNLHSKLDELNELTVKSINLKIPEKEFIDKNTRLRNQIKSDDKLISDLFI